ncbi:MAG: hypothetical protein ABIB79_02215, partial [archaeon]
VPYNYYLRNDPRDLEKSVPFDNVLELRKNVVLNLTSSNLFCGGDWNIAMSNMVGLYRLLEMNVSAINETSVYEPVVDYIFIIINEANESEIRRTAVQEYNLDIANCEVLQVTERMMVEALVQFYEKGVVED